MTGVSKSSLPKSIKGRKPISSAQYETRRDEIITAANKLFIDKGYLGVSMRSLAREINMSPMSLYRYFDNKRAILMHIWADVFERLFTQCRRASQPHDDPIQALEIYGQNFVQYWITHCEHYQMIYGVIDRPASSESFFAHSDIVSAELIFLQDLLEDAGIVTEQSELVCQQYICILHGVSHSLVTIPEFPWHNHEKLVSGLVRGLITQNG